MQKHVGFFFSIKHLAYEGMLTYARACAYTAQQFLYPFLYPFIIDRTEGYKL